MLERWKSAFSYAISWSLQNGFRKPSCFLDYYCRTVSM